MRAAVIIPAHNGERHLGSCLEALARQQGAAFDTIVVDNGSTDGGADLVARHFPQVRLIHSAAPLGFAGACNRGIRETLGVESPPDAVVLLNQDTVVDPGWLAALLRPLAEDQRLGVVGSLARFGDGRLQHAGGELTWPLGYGRNIGGGLMRLPEPLPPPDYLAFLATALRPAMLSEIGLLDEGFGAGYFEDADLCLRARAAGWGLALAREATLVHHEGAPGEGDYRHAALVERNRLRLALKHRPLEDLLGPFLTAEREQLRERARAGVSQVLRQAYLHALLALPEIAAARGWDRATREPVADALAGLRDAATASERRVRGGTLTPLPPSPAAAGEGENERCSGRASPP